MNNSPAPIRAKIVREWRYRAECAYTLRDARHSTIYLGATARDAAEVLAVLNDERRAQGLAPYLVDDHAILVAAMELAMGGRDDPPFPPPELGGEG